MQQESRIVQSGLTLAFPNEREGIFVNICQSQALKAPSSLSLNQADVPVLVSPSRPFNPGTGTIKHFEGCLSLNSQHTQLDNRLVFDVVYHNSVLEECSRNPAYLKAIVELSLDCLDELHQIKLKCSHYDLTKESYVGPYAWGKIGYSYGSQYLTKNRCQRTSSHRISYGASPRTGAIRHD